MRHALLVASFNFITRYRRSTQITWRTIVHFLLKHRMGEREKKRNDREFFCFFRQMNECGFSKTLTIESFTCKRAQVSLQPRSDATIWYTEQYIACALNRIHDQLITHVELQFLICFFFSSMCLWVVRVPARCSGCTRNRKHVCLAFLQKFVLPGTPGARDYRVIRINTPEFRAFPQFTVIKHFALSSQN